MIPSQPSLKKRIQRSIGWLGATVAGLFFAWLVLGFLKPVPSMFDVFGDTGIRTPAAITIFALLLAAIGFFEE